MQKRNPYEVLAVDKTASAADIKKSYKRLAMKHHPDRNPDSETAEEQFKEITAAHEILSDEKKRASFDQYGHEGLNRQSGGSHQHTSDVFNQFFGHNIYKGQDKVVTVSLTLEEIMVGKIVTIDTSNDVTCSTCSGSGAKTESGKKQCQHCGGSGVVISKQGFFSTQTPCPHCKGSGILITNPCDTCKGSGVTKVKSTRNVKIPAGINHNDAITIRGEGESSSRPGHPNGNLYVKVAMKHHKDFTRSGNNLDCNVNIDIATAALGDQITVPIINGELKMKIPPGTQTGKILKVANKGVPNVHGKGSGNIMYHIIVKTPTKLSEEQKELLQQFKELG